jgi:hypothetical protein
MKPWREGWPGGKIGPHYAQSEKIKGKLGVGKKGIPLDFPLHLKYFLIVVSYPRSY